ncbi:beta strand repeat-containing protein [Hymenobacter canadensis]|uniref:T9SS type A sorting domain-containing protein n=1 Tax=Hymenobacter canadensis TaxID=2999067 RepID=A0ABY7LXR7_9BACT|nr:T9SS type A sorting domain-containing protein [Hymenobacter canadensis]WBA44065.1 T9SS type A sorting domain-containing protein [Hymenobacter canadensis]
MQLYSPGYFPATAALRACLLLLFLLGISTTTHAANYYWVGNTGAWTEMSHWASTSGGTGNAYANVPKNTDNVYFDANSFTANSQRVTIVGTVTCRDMTWSGNVRQATFVQGASGVLEINGDLRYTATMATTPTISVPHRMLAATTGAVVDMQGVPFGATLLFDSANGGWTFTSPFNGTSGAVVNISAARQVSFGSTTLTFSTLSTYTGMTAVASIVPGILDLGSSTTTLLAQASPGAFTLNNPNLTLTAGTSTLNVGASALTNYTSPVSFTTSKAFAFHTVVVNSGNGALFNVANSSFNTLTVNSRLTLGSAATIGADGNLTLAADAALLLAPGATKALSFGSGATLATSGGCAGLGTIQSTLAGSPAILARSGGWASAPISYAVLQDLTFTDGSSGNPANGAAVATASANQGGNAGITISGLPVTDLYWVGNSGNWHDPSHWASVSGGSTVGNTCLPTVFTNVHFDANSFTAPGRTVTLDLTGQQCRNMDWTGVTNKPTLNAASRCGLTVAGSLTLVGPASLTQALAADVFLGQPGGGSYTLTTAGQPLAAHLWFRAAGGSYALLDDVTTTGRVFVESGTFTTNDHLINAQSFSSGYVFNNSVYTTGSGPASPLSLSPPTVNLGTSVLNLLGTNTRNDANAVVSNYAWDVASVTTADVTTTPVTLNAGSSTINLLNGNNTPFYNSIFRGGLGLTYGTVTFSNNTGGTSATIIGNTTANDTFQNLLFYGSATIGSNNSITGQLLLSPGKTYLVPNATTQTFTPGATLNAVGTCSNYITIIGPSSAAATRFISASNAPLQYVILKNTDFSGGATWQDQSGLDNGSNTGIAFLPPATRTLYWVGEGGNWNDAAHWSLSSGGSGGACTPSLVDNVVVDANSVTTTGQTLTINLASASCRSIDCSALTNGKGLTLRNVTGNLLSVYGSVTWAPEPNLTLALAGGLAILGPGTASTLTSAGQRLTGTLNLNVPGGSVTLADAFASTAGITHTAGTLATNNQPVSIPNYVTSTVAAKVLQLGASPVTVNGIWVVAVTSNLTIAAGTSRLTVNANVFTGGGQSYYDVLIDNPLTVITLAGNNAFHDLQLTGSTNIQGNNTISGTLTFLAGRAYVFTAGNTTTFGPNATLVSVGLSNNPVTLQSSVNGSLFTWTKATGGICADYTYIRDSRATGGAYFEAGRNGANNQGNNPGWSFGFLPRASYVNRTTCPAEGAHTLRIDFTAYDNINNVSGLALPTAHYPLTLRVHNLTANTYEDVSAPTTPYYYPIPTSTATTQYQVVALATSPTSGCGTTSNTDLSTFPVVTDAILAGPAGTWSGNSAPADGNWLDCHNWASGNVPDASTDATISPNTTSVSLGNSLTANVAVQPTLNGAGAAVRTLTIPAGATFTLGSSAQLAVAGDWVNNGTVTSVATSQVTFQGTSPQTLTAGTFGSVVVKNATGLTLATDASTSGTLMLSAGTITTGLYKWVHSNASASSLSGYGAGSYVAGTLRRAIASNTVATYAFPVGTASQYALYELLDHNLSGSGFGTIDASFGPKPGTDANLTYLEPGYTPYRAIHSAGVWTLTPDSQPSAGTYDAKVSLLPFSALIDNSFTVLKRPDTSTDAADWTGGGGTLNPNGGAGRLVANGYALRLGLISFSQFGLGQMVGAAPLPVTLTRFTATASGSCAVRLDWATASEINNDRFELERSADGRSFQKITTVASRNSASGSTYGYTDQQPGEGLNYYRLRQIDLDRTSTYSPVTAFAITCGAGGPVRLVPNPATNTVRLLGLRPGQMLCIYSSAGRLVYAAPASQPDELLEVSGWVPGLYLVHVRNADGGLAGKHKLLKQ